MQTIHIEGIKLYAYHGCLPEEAKIGGNYIVDVSLSTDLTKASISDNLNDTIDYCTVYEICKLEMAIRSNLIEHVGKRIHDKLRTAFSGLSHLQVKITKISPPMNGDVEKVTFEIES